MGVPGKAGHWQAVLGTVGHHHQASLLGNIRQKSPLGTPMQWVAGTEHSYQAPQGSSGQWAPEDSGNQWAPGIPIRHQQEPVGSRHCRAPPTSGHYWQHQSPLLSTRHQVPLGIGQRAQVGNTRQLGLLGTRSVLRGSLQPRKIMLSKLNSSHVCTELSERALPMHSYTPRGWEVCMSIIIT